MAMGALPAALFGLALAVGLLVLVWIGSLVRRDASLVDRFWGVGFVALAWFYALSAPGRGWPAWLLVSLVTIWGLRLSVYLTWRNWGRGEDYRYAAMRERQGPSFAWTSLGSVFLLQAILMWGISLGVLAGARAAGKGESAPWLVWLGVTLWAVGFYFEAVGDWQLARFRANPANRGHVLDRGVWRYTRHPNYFGDAAMWWGFCCFSLAQGAWWGVASSVLMTGLLLKVSGVALLERRLVDTKPQYRDYVERTSAFLPWPRRASRTRTGSAAPHISDSET